MTTKEYGSYIKGLMDGANFDTTTSEGKIIAALAEIAQKLAAEVDTLREEVEVLNAYIEEIDEDLGEVEEFVYDLEDDCDCCDCDEDDDDCLCCGDDCCCCDCEDEDEEELYCAMCPNCGDKVYFNDTVNPEDIVCPSCKTSLVGDDDEEE